MQQATHQQRQQARDDDDRQHQQTSFAAAPQAAAAAAAAAGTAPHAAHSSVDAAAAAPVRAVPPSAVLPSAVLDMNRMVVFCADKAGMSTTDSLNSKELINKVIYDSSVGSAHFKAAQARNDKVAERIEKMKKNLTAAKARSAVRSPLAQAAALRMQRKLADMEQSRTLDRNWIHIDMDAFYAAVEIRDRPELADKPIAVGNMSMISTSNYVARKYGVRSAMPGFIAIKLCPQLQFLPHNWPKYKKAAEQTRDIFRDYDPHFESGSMDEAYLDVTAFVRREQRRRARGLVPEAGSNWGLKRRKVERTDAAASGVEGQGKQPPEGEGGADSDADAEAAEEDDEDFDPDSAAPLTPAEIDANSLLAAEVASVIRRRIFEVTHLTASAGIGCNRMLAKISTDINKPNGQHHLPSRPDEIVRFMNGLSVRKIPGVGKVMERVLNELGMNTCEQMHATPEAAMLLHDVFSADTAHWLLSVSLGIASAEHHAEEDNRRKSISTERTFRALSSYADLEAKLVQIATALAEDLVKRKCAGGKNVTLKLKTTAFDLCTRSITLERFVSSREDLIKYGTQLLKEEIDRLSATAQAKQFKQVAHASPAAAVTVAGSPLKPAAQTGAAIHAAHSSSPSAAAAALRPAAHANSRDGVLHLRLMGLRLSALKDDAPDAHASGTQSILNFIKTAPAAATAATAAVMDPCSSSGTAAAAASSTAAAAASSFGASSAAAKQPLTNHSQQHLPSDADIASFFDAAPDAAKASPAAPVSGAKSKHAAAPTLDRFFTGKSLSAAMSASARPAAGAAASRTTDAALMDLTVEEGGDSWAHEAQAGADEEEEGWVEEWISQPDRELLRLDDAPTFADDEPVSAAAAATAAMAAAPTITASAAANLASASTSISAATPSPSLSATVSPPAPPSLSSSSLSCPVCGKDLGREVGNLELNRHIDRCLGGGGKAPATGAAAAAKGKAAGNKRKHAPNAHAANSSSNKGVQTLTDILARAKQHSANTAAAPAAAPAARRSHPPTAPSAHDTIQLD